MTKQDLITVVGSKTGQNDSHVRPIIEATLDAIKECVQRKEPVYLRGFGTFQPKKRAEKKARNITGRYYDYRTGARSSPLQTK